MSDRSGNFFKKGAAGNRKQIGACESQRRKGKEGIVLLASEETQLGDSIVGDNAIAKLLFLSGMRDETSLVGVYGSNPMHFPSCSSTCLQRRSLYASIGRSTTTGDLDSAAYLAR